MTAQIYYDRVLSQTASGTRNFSSTNRFTALLKKKIMIILAQKELNIKGRGQRDTSAHPRLSSRQTLQVE